MAVCRSRHADIDFVRAMTRPRADEVAGRRLGFVDTDNVDFIAIERTTMGAVSVGPR